MSNDTHGSPSSKPRFCSPSGLTQIQIERLKREDEDEHWISGEELYTEGSSDDDEDRIQALGTCRVSPRCTGRSTRSCHPVPALSGNNISSTIIRHHKVIPSTQSNEEKTGSLTAPEFLQDTKSTTRCCHHHHSEKKIETVHRTIADGEDETKSTEEEISWRPKRGSMTLPNSQDTESPSSDSIDDTKSSNVYDENEERDDRKNIEILEETIIDLRNLRHGYEDIVDSISELKSLNDDPVIVVTNSLESDTDHYNVTAAVINGLETYPGAINCYRITQVENEVNSFFSRRDHRKRSDSNRLINLYDKIEKEISNVVKLDTSIAQLQEKLEKESEETRREQVLNRRELKRLQSLRDPESGHLAKNSFEFFELCSLEKIEIERESESLSSMIKINRDEEEDEKFYFNDEEARESCGENVEKKFELVENNFEGNFVERNKELASCAMGKLAITDDEKKRLEELLEDDSTSPISSTPYKIDEEADKLLKNLTEQLTKNINSARYRKSCEEESGEFLSKKEQLVFNSFKNLSESKSEVIHPITECEIKKLIDEYHVEKKSNSSSSLSVNRFDKDKSSSSGSSLSENSTLTPDIINELVKEAKTEMPLFKFKYHKEKLEERRNEEESN